MYKAKPENREMERAQFIYRRKNSSFLVIGFHGNKAEDEKMRIPGCGDKEVFLQLCTVEYLQNGLERIAVLEID